MGNLKKEPVTIKALCGIHKTVMEGTTRNRCGRLEDLDRFIQMESEMDALVKAAMAYYQFETIHPFEYGKNSVLQKTTDSQKVLETLHYVFDPVVSK